MEELRERAISRRAFLGGLGGLLASGAAEGAMRRGGRGGSLPAGPTFAYVAGGATPERPETSGGITVFRVEAESADWRRVQSVTDLENPSCLALDSLQRTLYAARETGRVAAFRLDPETGELALLNRQESGGTDPAHLAFDPTGLSLLVANRGSGTVAVFPIEPDGSLAPPSDLVPMDGAGEAHPQQILFDPRGRFCVVPDMGLNALRLFRLDGLHGKLKAEGPAAIPARPGAGPRFAAFNPARPYLYVSHALDSTVVTFRYDVDRGALDFQQRVSTLPAEFTGRSAAAEIAVAPSGDFLFVSNCGHESIARLVVDARTGDLAPGGWTPSQGCALQTIRLDLTGTILYAANRASDTIVRFRVDGTTGILTPGPPAVHTAAPNALIFKDRHFPSGPGGRPVRPGGIPRR